MKSLSLRLRVAIKFYARAMKRSPRQAALIAMITLTVGLAIGLAHRQKQDRQKFSANTFSRWNQYHKIQLHRLPASAVKDTCLSSDASFANIDLEIQRLESKLLSAHTIEGNWYGVNLKVLPSPQAHLLADYGEILGDRSKSKNFRGCKSAICVFNQVAQDPSKLYGKLVYYWYLKTGSMISLSNPPGAKKLSPYLFTLEELKDLYTLAKSLPASFIHNPLFRSIQKVANLDGKKCVDSLPSGSIHISAECLRKPGATSSLITLALTRYIDQRFADKNGKLFSQREQWLEASQWSFKEYWSFGANTYQIKWSSSLSPNFSSPEEQFSQLLADYRFSPRSFQERANDKAGRILANHFFPGVSYDPKGLLRSYLKTSINEWSRREERLWAHCLESHYDPPNRAGREVANFLEDPLIACVENKIPAFKEEMLSKLKSEQPEACAFFNENHYTAESKHYKRALEKYLLEQILQRKIELKRHGQEVLLGLMAKQEFLEKIDPASIVIYCHQEADPQNCYQQALKERLTNALKKRKFSPYYQASLEENILELFPYEEVRAQTNELAKRFVTPFYSRARYAASFIWESCKAQGPGENRSLKLPLLFTGGRHYMNAKLLNCVNEKTKEELLQMTKLELMQKNEEQAPEFKLSPSERKFALSFLEGKMRQIYNAILEEEIRLEDRRLASHFSQSQKNILQTLQSDKTLLESLYSYDELKGRCLDSLAEFYPSDIFYRPKSMVHKDFGRKICAHYAGLPGIQKTANAEIQKSWEENKRQTLSEFIEEIADKAEDCRSQYADLRMAQICLEKASEVVMKETIKDWRQSKYHKHFVSKEGELMASLRANLTK